MGDVRLAQTRYRAGRTPRDRRPTRTGEANVDTPTLQRQQTLHLKQRITLMVNQYEVLASDGSGNAGDLVAFAQQKRMALKEQVTLYTDSSKSQVVAGFKARQ